MTGYEMIQHAVPVPGNDRRVIYQWKALQGRTFAFLLTASKGIIEFDGAVIEPVFLAELIDGEWEIRGAHPLVIVQEMLRLAGAGLRTEAALLTDPGASERAEALRQLASVAAPGALEAEVDRYNAAREAFLGTCSDCSKPIFRGDVYAAYGEDDYELTCCNMEDEQNLDLPEHYRPVPPRDDE